MAPKEDFENQLLRSFGFPRTAGLLQLFLPCLLLGRTIVSWYEYQRACGGLLSTSDKNKIFLFNSLLQKGEVNSGYDDL